MPPSPSDRATKRQRLVPVSERPLFAGFDRDIPSPIVSRIFAYMDISSLVQMAGCNSAWKSEIYENHQDHPKLWTRIDFGTLDPIQAVRVTDQQLHSLLENCSAKSRCMVLKLMGCHQISGRGLQPLVGSCVLQQIDLRLTTSNDWGRPEIDLDSTLPILSSMPPMANLETPPNTLGLALVQFSFEVGVDVRAECYYNYYSKFVPRIGEWLGQFREALGDAAIAKGTQCRYCSRVMLDITDEEDRDWLMATSYCEKCHGFTCEGDTGTGCPYVRQCQFCLFQCCQPVLGLYPTHKVVEACGVCDVDVCEDCEGGIFVCPSARHLIWPYGRRIICRDEVCARHIRVCWGCKEEFCVDCCEHCNNCNNGFCQECRDGHTCAVPTKTNETDAGTP